MHCRQDVWSKKHFQTFQNEFLVSVLLTVDSVISRIMQALTIEVSLYSRTTIMTVLKSKWLERLPNMSEPRFHDKLVFFLDTRPYVSFQR